ncbi:uncharacterized protein LOC106673455 isoform X2 [Cimex lectularius]|uniref:DUF4773 domain-containing protein n=1 Tax=Cimex lectularius TaxID=79782 RepID=A0A8I6SAI0_CIMLE|nr:uncharacterized protein LOC106673455 isoform X2 [Cimex lectularius]
MWNFCILLTIAVLGTSNAFHFNYNHDNIITNTCKALNDEWKCCQTSSNVWFFKLTVCGNLKLLRKSMGMKLSVAFNGYTIDKTFSVRNPPSICYLGACAKFYNMDWENQTVSGCLAAEAQLIYFHSFLLKIGCFQFPLPTDEISKTTKAFLKGVA